MTEETGSAYTGETREKHGGNGNLHTEETGITEKAETEELRLWQTIAQNQVATAQDRSDVLVAYLNTSFITESQNVKS